MAPELFERVLVAIDSEHSSHPELDRAKRLAISSKATLHVVDVLRDLNLASRWLSSQLTAAHDQLAEEKIKTLEQLRDQCRTEHIETTCELLRGNFSAQILRGAEQRKVDLIVRSAKGSNSTAQGFIGSTSSQLLRKAPCSVWLTQGEHPARCRKILAAVDATPDDQAHAELNRKILTHCQAIAQQDQAEVHVVYVWNLYGAELLEKRMQADDFAELVEHNRACHAESYEKMLKDYGFSLNQPQVHMPRGEATVIIPDLCTTDQFDLLVCGTVSRVGISGLMIGNTANRMLGRVPCSVLALKPDRVQ